MSILQQLGRIEGKQDMALDQLKTLQTRLDAQDERLRKVENRSAVMGAIGALIVTLGIEAARFTLRKNG